MKTTSMTLGWLVMAAALAFTACSSEDNLAVEQTMPQTATKIHVSVGAGIDSGDGGQTRSVVEQTGTTRKLKFSAGDNLWVMGQKHIEEGDYWYDIQGQLAIGTIGNDGTTAQFSGDLTVNKWNNSAPDLDLSSLEGLWATLVPAGTTYFKVETYPNGHKELIAQQMGIATGNLNDLMATNTFVRGTFGAGTSVTLKAQTAFFNCTVTGLAAKTAYNVGLAKEQTVSITTDGSGNLHFLAWFRLDGESEDIPGMRFYIGTNKRVILDSKTLYAKVYNMTRAAETYTPFTVIDNTTSNPVEPENGMFYSFKEGDADITISGESEGQTITLWGSNDRVVMSGVTATSYEAFINEQYDGGTLNIVLNGANSITINDPMYGGQAIHSNGPLYFSGNGTLTVTVTATDFYGLMGSNYQPGDGPTPATNTDASVLAASGYTVSRSNRIDGPDNDQDGNPDYYTWTYTVQQE